MVPHYCYSSCRTSTMMAMIRHAFNFSNNSSRLLLVRLFSTSGTLTAKPLPPRPKLDDKDITGSYLKGSGPGGQKINKTNSAVQLIHKPTGIVVKSQATRSRSQNQKIAREILAAKVEQLEKGEQSREAIKQALKSRRKASKAKKSRRKYRELQEKKQKGEEEEEGKEFEEDEEQEQQEEEKEDDDSNQRRT